MFVFSFFLAMMFTQMESVMDADTPDLFLEALASASAEEWIESMVLTEDSLSEDSIRVTIVSFQELSVEPGIRILEDFDGGYRAVFSESRWTWRLPQGRIGSVTGESVVEWRPGGYRWATVPLFTEKGTTVGPKETLCLGVIAMSAVILVGIVAIWYVKRRYS